MAVSNLPDNTEIMALSITEIPPCKLRSDLNTAQQVACHLRRVLEIYGEGMPPSLKIPSTIELARFFNRSILEILDGLFEMKKQHFEYVMLGLDGEIILHDPLGLTRRRGGRVGGGWKPMAFDSGRFDARKKTYDPRADIFSLKGA